MNMKITETQLRQIIREEITKSASIADRMANIGLTRGSWHADDEKSIKAWKTRHIRTTGGKRRYVWSEAVVVDDESGDLYTVVLICPHQKESIINDLQSVGFHVKSFSTYNSPTRGANIYQEEQPTYFGDSVNGLSKDSFGAWTRPCNCVANH